MEKINNKILCFPALIKKAEDGLIEVEKSLERMKRIKDTIAENLEDSDLPYDVALFNVLSAQIDSMESYKKESRKKLKQLKIAVMN